MMENSLREKKIRALIQMIQDFTENSTQKDSKHRPYYWSKSHPQRKCSAPMDLLLHFLDDSYKWDGYAFLYWAPKESHFLVQSEGFAFHPLLEDQCSFTSNGASFFVSEWLYNPQRRVLLCMTLPGFQVGKDPITVQFQSPQPFGIRLWHLDFNPVHGVFPFEGNFAGYVHSPFFGRTQKQAEKTTSSILIDGNKNAQGTINSLPRSSPPQPEPRSKESYVTSFSVK
jgi:hypothetical protein